MKKFTDLPNPCLYEERYTKISEPQNIQVGILQFCCQSKTRQRHIPVISKTKKMKKKKKIKQESRTI